MAKFCSHFQQFVDILTEALITEASIVPFERYGQVIFLIGGAGSGKNFVLNHMIENGGTNVDVDTFKKFIKKKSEYAYGVIEKKLKNIQGVLPSLTDDKKKNEIEKMIEKYETFLEFLSGKITMKNIEHVAKLHAISKILFEDEGGNNNMLSSILKAASMAQNKDNIPNITVNITGKNLSELEKIAQFCKLAGYAENNMHIVWVLTPHWEAQKSNKDRDRTIDRLIVKETHKGARETFSSIRKDYSSLRLSELVNGKIVVVFNSVDKRDSDIVFGRKSKRNKDGVFWVKAINRVVLKNVGEPIKSDEQIDKEIKRALNTSRPQTKNPVKSIDDFNGRVKDYTNLEKNQKNYS